MSAFRSASLFVLIVLAGCDKAPEPGPSTAAPSQPTLATSNAPLAWLVGTIAGSGYAVATPYPTSGDPAHWQPTVEAVLALQAADVVVVNGAGYEHWRHTVSLPDRQVLDSSAGLQDRLIQLADHGHRHGPEGAQTHHHAAFTTWLDPSLFIAQGEAIAAGLGDRFPADRAGFRTRFAAARSELQQLDRDFAAVLAPLAERPVVVSHPVYQYFARRYGLAMTALHWEPETDPGPAAWDELRELAAAGRADWFIWEGEPSAANAAALARLGIPAVVVDPAAGATGRWLAQMQANVAALRALQLEEP